MTVKKGLIAFFPFAFLILTMLLYMLLVPPFQNPDEVQHFGIILSKLYPDKDYKRLESELLTLMWEYKWFRFVGMGQPEGPESIGSLESIPFLKGFSIGTDKGLPGLYHRTVAFFMFPFKGLFPVLGLFYLSRFISFLFSLAIIFLFYSHFRERGHANTVLYLMMIPQFLMIGTSVSYEVFSSFFGGLFFLALFQLRESYSFNWFVLMNIGLIGSLLSKKGGWLFFIYLGFSIFLFTRLKIRKGRMLLISFGFLMLVFAWLNYLFPAIFRKLYVNLFIAIERGMGIGGGNGIALDFIDFITVIFKSFFIQFGWMAFDVSQVFYLLFYIFLIAGILGYLFLSKTDSLPNVFYFCTILLTIFSAIWIYYGQIGVHSQGRYLFPIIFLLFIIVINGLKNLDNRIGSGQYPSIQTLLKLFLIISNIYILLFKIIPVFYLAIPTSQVGV